MTCDCGNHQEDWIRISEIRKKNKTIGEVIVGCMTCGTTTVLNYNDVEDRLSWEGFDCQHPDCPESDYFQNKRGA